MKRQLLFLLPTILCVLQLSCNKPSYTYSPPQKVPIEATVWDVSNVKTGSYWILKDSLTGEEDSLVMFWNTPKFYTEYGICSYESYNSYMIQYHNADTLFFWRYQVKSYDVTNSKPYSFSSLTMLKTMDDTYKIPMSPIVFTASIDTNTVQHVLTTNYSYSTKTILELLSNVFINGNNYSLVYRTKHISLEEPFADEVFFNKSHGILKMVLDNPYQHTTLLLERCHIERN